MTGKRTRYSAEFKAKVALEAIRGEMTVAQLAAKHSIHQTMINAWKKQATEGMAEVFAGNAEAAEANREAEIEHLHTKIGQLVVERDCQIASKADPLFASNLDPLWRDAGRSCR